jgi:hypothetical protein
VGSEGVGVAEGACGSELASLAATSEGGCPLDRARAITKAKSSSATPPSAHGSTLLRPLAGTSSWETAAGAAEEKEAFGADAEAA